jgi:hypothetical protein
MSSDDLASKHVVGRSKKLKVTKAVVTNVLEEEVHGLKADHSAEDSVAFLINFTPFEVLTVKLTLAANAAHEPGHKRYGVCPCLFIVTYSRRSSPSREEWVQIMD